MPCTAAVAVLLSPLLSRLAAHPPPEADCCAVLPPVLAVPVPMASPQAESVI